MGLAPFTRAPPSRFLLSVLLVSTAATCATAASDAEFARCLANDKCKALYHQHPPHRATFDAIYALGTAVASDDAVVVARVADLRLCPHNERYVVTSTGEGVCTCPDDGQLCGVVTPFFNAIIYAACVLSTVSIVVHVTHRVWSAV